MMGFWSQIEAYLFLTICKIVNFSHDVLFFLIIYFFSLILNAFNALNFIRMMGNTDFDKFDEIYLFTVDSNFQI